MILSTSFSKQFYYRERCFSSCCERQTNKKFWVPVYWLKTYHPFYSYEINFSYPVFIIGKSCIKQVKSINVFFDINLLSFPSLLGANLWRGSLRRFRYKLIQLSCTAHDKIIIIIIIIIVIIFTVHRQKVESTCAVKTRRMELTAHYRKKTFWNSQATFCSFSERCETYLIAFYLSTTRCKIFHTNMTCVN